MLNRMTLPCLLSVLFFWLNGENPEDGDHAITGGPPLQ